LNCTNPGENIKKIIALNSAVVIMALMVSACGQPPAAGLTPPSSAKNPGGGAIGPVSPTTATVPVSPSKPVPPPAQSAAPIPVDSRYSVSLVSSAATVKAGDIFTIDVRLDLPIPTRGAQCGLTFDSKLMKCDGVSEGGYFKDWAKAQNCTTVNYPQAKIDNATGTVSDYGIAVIGEAPGGQSGSGVFCTYRFTALTAGTPAPKLIGVIIADENGATAMAVVK
jgi:hypothetical protein